MVSKRCALNICNSGRKGYYDNLFPILKELLLLPVTSASVELAKSSLGFIKLTRRNSVIENQINVFLLVFYHTDIFVIV